MNIGQKIKQLRFQRSLTQDQLAERLGISARLYLNGKMPYPCRT